MASFIFNSAMYDEARGQIDFDTDSFKVMLLTSTATPNKDTWTRRSDVTNEVASTGGYSAGSATGAASVSGTTLTQPVELVAGTATGAVLISGATLTQPAEFLPGTAIGSSGTATADGVIFTQLNELSRS